MHPDLDRILIPRERIAQRVREVALAIEQTYARDAETGLTILMILSGSLMFVADLVRELPLRLRIGLISVSSYRGPTTAALDSRVLHDLTLDVRGQHVLIVDDILDTGGTLRMVRERTIAAGARSIRICVLLRKPSRAPKDVQADFVGFDIEDVFVVGYGLDYNDHYRNLPDVGVLRQELYEPGAGRPV